MLTPGSKRPGFFIPGAKVAIHCEQLREFVIRPTLKRLDLWSPAAENLLLGTAAQESHMGTYLKQLGTGPALGIFQMEPATHTDIWENYLRYKSSLRDRVLNGIGASFRMITEDGRHVVQPKLLAMDLSYAAAMCRIHYLRVPEALPAADDVDALAAFWKKYYNTTLGKGTVDEFKANYAEYVTA